jgi:hypothetical protein
MTKGLASVSDGEAGVLTIHDQDHPVSPVINVLVRHWRLVVLEGKKEGQTYHLSNNDNFSKHQTCLGWGNITSQPWLVPRYRPIWQVEVRVALLEVRPLPPLRPESQQLTRSICTSLYNIGEAP